MAKVTGQNIPPAYYTMAGRVLTKKHRNGTTVTHTTNRKAAKKSTKIKPEPDGMNDFSAAAKYIAQLMIPEKSERQNAALARALVREMKAGIFNTDYWLSAPLLTTEFLISHPSSIPDPNPPPYNYRTQQFMPTIPTYQDGTPGNYDIRYTGAKNGLFFEDGRLSWGKYIYAIPTSIEEGTVLFAFAVITGTMSVTSSARASKPMLSVISSAALVSSTDSAISSRAPITQGIPVSAPTQTRLMQSHYWRYKIPKTSPPYFYHERIRPIVRNIVRSSSIVLTTTDARAIILLAPRPMFGRGFNNNNNVETTLNPECIVWVLIQDQDCNARIDRQNHDSGGWETTVFQKPSNLIIDQAWHALEWSAGYYFRYTSQTDIRVRAGKIRICDLYVYRNLINHYVIEGYYPVGNFSYLKKTKTATFEIIEAHFNGNPNTDPITRIRYRCTAQPNGIFTREEVSRTEDNEWWIPGNERWMATPAI